MNKYEIIGIVGEGAYGIVYKAKNKETGDIGIVVSFNPCGSGYKEIQRVRWGWNSKENDFQRSQNAKNVKTREYSLTKRSF